MVLDCIMSLVKVVLQDMLQALAFVMSMFTAVLQSMPSPLEMCSCIAVVDVSDGKNCLQIALAVTNLFLAVCDWHVPRVIPHHNFICRFLSAMCMQTLFPYSPTLTCLAFLYPTFGKKGADHIDIGTRLWSRCIRARFYIGEG